MMKQRRRRDQRLQRPRPMRLTKRDLDIIEAVHYYRILKQEQLQALFFGSRATAQLRLQKLFDHGYLARKFLPMGIGQGRSPTIYVLDRLGAELLRAERGYDKLSLQASGKTLTSPFVEHTLMVNDVLVAVYRACKVNHFTLEQWQGEAQVKRNHDTAHIGDESGQMKIPILPDSYFSVIAHGRRHRFFLEVDRGTMTISRFKKKVEAYLTYHRSGGYEQRYGSRALRILTVTPGDNRLRQLVRATAGLGGDEHFWFTTREHLADDKLLTEPVWTVRTSLRTRALIGSGS